MPDGNGEMDRKVTFSEIFRVGEFRAIFTSTQLAELGDHMSKAAVTALVFFVTESVALSAATFAISYVPWVVGGPFLATLAERLRYRAVMVASDTARALVIGLVTLVALTMLPSTTQAATDGVPAAIWLIIGLLLLESLLAPPALAARSAVMPLVLTGERVTLGLAMNQTGRQATQVLGYMGGALIAIVDPALALGINAVAYVVTALITRFGLRDRAPALTTDNRSHLLRETKEGFQIVFGTPTLRMIAVVVFAAMLFAIVPEGLAVSWAQELAQDDQARRGLYQGLIMVASPVGHVIAALLIIRLLRPSVRARLVKYFLVMAPLALVPAVFSPGIVPVVIMTLVSGMAVSGMLPTLNGVFVQILRHGYRARAFGVMNSGMMVVQGCAVLAVGAIVGVGGFSLPVVVGVWSLAGVALMVALASRWPKPEVFAEAIAANAGSATEPTATTQAVAAAQPGTTGEPGATGAPIGPEPAVPTPTPPARRSHDLTSGTMEA